MASNKIAFTFVLVVAFTQVASWTIDLPDVRKFMFEKYGDRKENEENVGDGRQLYSNVEGNSMHHLEQHKDYDNKNYANEYGYVSYMEKKVNGIVRSGGGYLEGLRRAIERYTQFLESCNNQNNSVTRNLTTWQPPMDSAPSMPSGENMTSNFSFLNPPSFNFSQPSFNSSQPGLNFSDSAKPRSSFNASNMSISCEEVSGRSEQVRRLAQLATWATMRLQDLAYASKYQKIDEYEENELILKLAWFLDRLAYLTGYEPEPKEFLPTTTLRPTTVSPTPLSLVPAPEPIKTAMMDCLKENSSIPATERCRYPLPIPEIVRQIFNNTSDSSPASTESMNVIPMPSRDIIPQQSLELLITSDDNPFRNYPPFPRSKRDADSKNAFVVIKKPFNQYSIVEYFKSHLADTKSTMEHVSRISNEKSTKKKQIINNKSTLQSVKHDKHIKKRSADNPTTKLMNYYFKYKVWDSSNPLSTNNNEVVSLPAHFDVVNHLANQKRIVKRSLFNKNDGRLDLITPLTNIRTFIKNKQRMHYHTYVVQRPKIVSHLQNLRHQINLSKVGKVDSKPKSIRKRSLYYENMYLPRESENPMRDISYYVKNKDVTEYNPSTVQAAQVRLGLEQIFQTGNIEVVRRYGANYNPADPAPFYTGVLRANADS